jgi:hypothetical protein
MARPAQAIRAYQKSIKEDDNQPLLNIRLGMLLLQRGRVTETIDNFAHGFEQANFPDLRRSLLDLLPLIRDALRTENQPIAGTCAKTQAVPVAPTAR